jgi:acyl-CoA synthetase (NDP forming)/GNAT superfamily N-acetyltransferase
VLLRDGRSVTVRLCGEGDAEGIAAMIAGMSREARAMRFGAAKRGLSPREAREMAAPPGPSGAGVVAVAGGEGERIVAVARYHRAEGADDAELAAAVADRWQGLGLGTALVERICAHAAAEGVDSLWAWMRSDNRRMRSVLDGLGGPVTVVRAPDGVLARVPLHYDAARDDATGARDAAAAAASLRPLMEPRGIAVVGASRDPAAPGGAVLRALREGGQTTRVYAVNRAADVVAGGPAYRSLALLPGPVDLVVVAVPAEAVPAVAREAAACGARALVVLSAGFAETGSHGAELQAELIHVCRTAGLRLVGPNCLGVSVSAGPAPFDATFSPLPSRSGRIALASQSGGLGVAALAHCAARGIGTSAFVSLGNGGDVAPEDLLAWWDADARTRVVLLYLEGVGDPRRFARIARRVSHRTPVVALKGGRGGAGRRAAGSHTAALAAGEPMTEALFDLAGVVRADTLEELLETGEVLASQPPPGGPRVAIVSNAGGPAIIAADAAEAAGLEVPPFGEPLRAALASLPTPPAADGNPVDLGAGSDADAVERAGRAIIASGEADALMVLVTPLRGTDADGMIRAAEALANDRVPVVGCVVGPAREAAAAAAPIPWLAMPEGAARALAGARRAAQAAARPEDPAVRPSGIDVAAARAALARAEPGAWLPPDAVERLLAAYGVPVARGLRAPGPAEAAAAQAAIGGPVAVKLVSGTLTHKSDVGGVVLGVRTPDEAAAAAERIAEGLRRRGLSDRMEGVLVQEMAPAGVDLIVGGVRDPVFGPCLLAGIGGADAEVWRDRRVALAPPGPASAHEIWDRLRGADLLAGWRGLPAVPRGPLADLTARVGWLMSDIPGIAELDLNPVRAGADGRPVALDARIRRAGNRDSGNPRAGAATTPMGGHRAARNPGRDVPTRDGGGDDADGDAGAEGPRPPRGG